MSLNTQLRILKRHLLVIGIALLLGSASGAAFGAARPLQYTSRQLFVVSVQNARDMGELSQGGSLAVQHAQMLTSLLQSPQALQNAVVAAGGIDSPRGMSLRVDHTTGASDLRIDSIAPEPDLATRLAGGTERMVMAESERLAPRTSAGSASVALTTVTARSTPAESGLPPKAVWAAVAGIGAALLVYLFLLARWAWTSPVTQDSAMWQDPRYRLAGRMRLNASLWETRPAVARMGWLDLSPDLACVILRDGGGVPEVEQLGQRLALALADLGRRPVLVTDAAAIGHQVDGGVPVVQWPSEVPSEGSVLKLLSSLRPGHDLVLFCPSSQEAVARCQAISHQVTFAAREQEVKEADLRSALDLVDAELSPAVILVRR